MKHEIYVLIAMIICAVSLSVLFDLCRGVRKALRLPDFVIIITDFLFWGVCAVTVTWTIWTVNSGIVRIYEFIGLILGALIYFLTVSVYVVRGFEAISAFIWKIIKIIFNFLLTPFCFLYKIISSIHIKRLSKKSEDIRHE